MTTTGDELMSVYPKIEVKRDEYVDVRPNELWADDELFADIDDAQADRWEALARFTEPLPDGVRWAMVARGDEIPEGWERHIVADVWGVSQGAPLTAHEVRPPPKPATEKVPWHEAMGRTLLDGAEVHHVSSDFDRGVWVCAAFAEIKADADGMVEVLVES